MVVDHHDGLDFASVPHPLVSLHEESEACCCIVTSSKTRTRMALRSSKGPASQARFLALSHLAVGQHAWPYGWHRGRQLAIYMGGRKNVNDILARGVYARNDGRRCVTSPVSDRRPTRSRCPQPPPTFQDRTRHSYTHLLCDYIVLCGFLTPQVPYIQAIARYNTDTSFNMAEGSAVPPQAKGSWSSFLKVGIQFMVFAQVLTDVHSRWLPSMATWHR